MRRTKYKIVSYNPITREHFVRSAKNESYTVDLFVDSSFKGAKELATIADILEYENSLVGKTVLIGSFLPLSFAAQKVELLNS